jgi:DNA modification methylase
MDIVIDCTMNLIESNGAYLTDNEKQELALLYTPVSDTTLNIQSFIRAYIRMSKRVHQQEHPVSNPLPIVQDSVNVIWGNCLDSLRRMPSESIGLMVTSPPYYNARDYSVWPTLQAYMDDMKAIIQEAYRVLENHRTFVWNVSDVVDNDNMERIKCWGDRKIPLPAYFIVLFEQCGFRYVDDLIWDKGEVQSKRHATSISKPFPFYQKPINCYEHVLIFEKHRLDETKYPCSDCGSLKVKSNSYTCKGLRSWECCNPDCNRSESNRGKRFSLKTIMTQDSEREDSHVDPETTALFRRDIFKMNPVIKINNKKENKLGHTAPFPSGIPEMAIQFFTRRGDVVLDMFGGSMTSAIAANKLGRVGVGCELRKDLFEECIRRNIESHGLVMSETTA